MGRGRQKAKHTKVARELKYFSPDTDLSQLQKELSGNDGASDAASSADQAWDDYDRAEEESA
jgi:hypothetical protein